MGLADVRTPALLLDRAVVARNAAAMTARMARLGVRLRPHLKTAKCAQVAALATAGNFGGIAVSTLAEAAYFVEHGFNDITYAVAIVPAKLDEVLALQDRGARIAIATDDPATAAALAERAPAFATTLNVLIEIDCGQHRAGLAPEAETLPAIARILDAAPNLALEGVMTHAGHAYHCGDVTAIERVAEDERAAAVRAAERLRAAGHACPTVSAGSTPTAVFARSAEGLTEMRPGVYTLFDLQQMALGCCRLEDIAVSVLATVVGRYPERGRLLIDAGSLALSADTGANEFLAGAGYGWVMDGTAARRLDGATVVDVNQEHGFVEGAALPFDDLPVGARVRVLPNHACITAAMHDRYHVVEGGEAVDVWERAKGW